MDDSSNSEFVFSCWRVYKYNFLSLYFPEFEIKEIVLRLDEISNKVILKNLTITTPKIDMYWPFMTSTFFTDFQIDKNDKFKIEITSILTSFINALLTNINN